MVCLLFATATVRSQTYNNEWIDYTKTYYKFKVFATGLYRIPQSSLSAIGLGGTPAEQFQLWRNGKQVAIYTSTATGALPTGGYLEFWGERNDGKVDKDLYKDPAFQVSDRISLLSDTAAYFLTVNAISSANLRLTEVANNVTGNTLPAEQSFQYTANIDFREKLNEGRFEIADGEYMYSSWYDEGEFWSTVDINQTGPYTTTLTNLFPAASGNVSFETVIAGASYIGGNRPVSVLLNNTQIAADNVVYNGTKKLSNAAVPLSLLSGGTAVFAIRNNWVNPNPSNGQIDRIVAAYIQLSYPRTFNFGNATRFNFTLPASSAGNYLEISNFNGGSATPVLYDLTNNKRYTAVTGNGLLRFVLQPSGLSRNLVLVSEDASQITTVSTLNAKTFVNLASTANQGNYLIISNSLLTGGSNNMVEQFRAYRASAAGGSYTARVYDVEELADQFAFGVKKHPLSIKNFLRYARNNFGVTPQFALLIGKGVAYNNYRLNQGNPNDDLLNIVPTFGYPASDNMLASATAADPVPLVKIGRLSAINQQEISIYLEKLKQYEAAQANTTQTIDNKAWMKNFVYVAGGSDASISSIANAYFNAYKAVVSDSVYGSNNYTFVKTESTPVTAITNAQLSALFERGIGLMNYFGHSSATTLDYNLDDPSNYNNTGKYPVFIVNGCYAGDFFTFDLARFGTISSLAERFVLAQQKGSIAFIASTSYGITSYLHKTNTAFYNSLGRSKGYNLSLGTNLHDAAYDVYQASLTTTSTYDAFLNRLHAEQNVLHGDPAIKVNAFNKPDFVVEEPQIVVTPTIVTASDNSFTVKTYFYNIGKAIGDSVHINVRRQYPDGSIQTFLSKKIKAVRYMDSVSVTFPLIGSRDQGENKILVCIDSLNKYDELSETNNCSSKTVYVYSDALKPVYPYEFAILSKNTSKLIASTANPIVAAKQYMMEIDTTEAFNSAQKVTRTVTTSGGVVEFDPGFAYRDSVVYYWRVAPVPASGSPIWNGSSFVYLSAAATPGFNQSHYYQHLKSNLQRMQFKGTQWAFGDRHYSFYITHAIFPHGGSDPSNYAVDLNGDRIGSNVDMGHSIVFMLFDYKTMKPIANQAVPSTVPIRNAQGYTTGGFMGSGVTQTPEKNFNFEFQIYDTTGRRKIRDFMDWIPTGTVVVVRFWQENDWPTVPGMLLQTWQNDQNVYGAGNTMYNRFKSAGFNAIDNYTSKQTWVYMYRKNVPDFPSDYRMTATELDKIVWTKDIIVPDTLGYVTSPAFGPARAWQQLKWRGSSLETTGDKVQLQLIGISPTNTETVLQTLPVTQQDVDISSVSAAQYPSLRLKLIAQDSVNLTPYQLRYWRLLYTPVPEGALAPNVYYNFKDTTEEGEPLKMELAFKNVSDVAFTDSIKVRVNITNQSNVTTIYPVFKVKDLAPGDTTRVTFNIDNTQYPGNSTLYLDVNPLADVPQPEQYHFNNFLYKNFYVSTDKIKPLLDVTFDGVHILNNDIVNAKPQVVVKLKDESKYLLLDDTSMVTINLQYPDGHLKRFSFGTDTLRFIPAASGSGNEARVEFNPTLLTDGDYQLIVKGKDKKNNPAGEVSYSVNFKVINKPMITNMFNYPNPFTTSTAFVFTLTGSEVPQNLRIQIMTITGKIVRDITKEELGPLHIGRNITEYKWDGTDQYGSKLANGVYLYRVITNLNGKSLDKFQTYDGNGNEVDTDKYFNKGYGKMYLMR